MPLSSPLPLRTCVTLLVPLVVGLACSSTSDDGGKGSGKSQEDPKASSDTREWTRIIEGDWTLEAGGEIPQKCVQQVMTEDVYVAAIRPVHPPGTHHTLLALGDGSTSCTSSLVSNGIIYAAGVGSEGLDLPSGVALKFPKGSVLSMGLHLYNVTDDELTGRSGMEIVRLAPEEVQHEAEAVLAGPFQLAIPPGRHTVSDECAVTTEQTVFALFPHMHQYGVHLKTTLSVAGSPKVVHDGPYDFAEQEQFGIGPVKLMPGDTISTECTYENTTSGTITFGESSDTEMCFSILFRYPAQGNAFCTGGGSSGITLDAPPCAAPGAPGNELGVGKECSKGGGECSDELFCLATFVGGDFPNFCTTTCAGDAECGTGATCSGSEGRTVCIPDTCALPAVADAGAGP